MANVMNDIAVFFNASSVGLRLLDQAAQLAAAHNSLLIGICVAASEQSRSQDAFVRGEAIADLIQRRQSATALKLLQAGKALRQAALRHGVETEFRVISHTESQSDLSMHSLYCDLLVVADALPGAPLAWSVGNVLKKTGVPILLIPVLWQGVSVGKRILVGWNGSRQARRAIADAMPLLKAAQSVDLLIVDMGNGRLLQEADQGVDMAAYLARHDVKVELVRIDGNGRTAQEVIVQQAAARSADMVVIGAYSHARWQEALFGGVTRNLLGATVLPLFIAH